MKPQIIGRTLGIGFRVAGRFAAQRIAGPPVPNTAPATASGQVLAASTAQAAAVRQTARRASRGVAKGVGGFLRPFRRVGGIVWLEVTGVLLLPVIVFGPKLWQTRLSWYQGPDHRTFVASAVLVAVFLYLGVSAFGGLTAGPLQIRSTTALGRSGFPGNPALYWSRGSSASLGCSHVRCVFRRDSGALALDLPHLPSRAGAPWPACFEVPGRC